MISRMVFLIAFFIFLSGGAQAGWIIDQVVYSTSTQKPKNQKVNSRNYFSKDKFKAVQGSSILIINYNTSQIFMYDRDRKLYWRGTIDEYINGIRDYMAQARREMEQSMKNMPPEQRRTIEEEMTKQGHSLTGEPKGATEAGRVKVEKTSERQTVAGYRAVKYSVYLDENSYQEIWISEDLDISKDMNMKKMQNFQNRINEAVGSVYSDRSSGVERSHEYQSLFEKGYPLKIVHVVGQSKGIIEVTSAKEKEIPDTEFDVPEGYRQTTLQEIIGMSVGRGENR
jgi:uncharacterized protein DUF4412